MVTDLTRSSWKATPENVAHIEEHLLSLNLEPGYTIVMELFGNSTFRYEQFDGTMALPFKGSHGYHMEGRIGVCEDDSLIRLLHNMESLVNIGNPEIKIFVPPLPRYLFTGCCALKNHSVNIKDPDHSEKLLASTLKFRNVIKNELLKKGTDSFFVMDGAGALIGIPPGGNRGTNKAILPELEKVCAKDGVHYTEQGYKNFAGAVIETITGLKAGTLTKFKSSHLKDGGAAEEASVSIRRRKESFFWRGFSSPVGAACPARPPMNLAISGPMPGHQNAGPDNYHMPGLGRGGRGSRRGRGSGFPTHRGGSNSVEAGPSPREEGNRGRFRGRKPAYFRPY
jgi:hypothetical protein